MSFGDFLELELLDHVLGNSAYTAPVNVYVALSTTTPNDDGTSFTEPTGGAYARVTVANNITNWPAAAAGAKSNGTKITFPTATASWGTVTHFALYDAVTAGNFLMAGALTTAKTIGNGDTAEFAIGDLDVTLD